MTDLPYEAWFYTREGERIGPVTFAELQALAREGGLNPRLDMVWTQEMADWKQAGELDGLFERRSQAPPPVPLAPAADPYTPPHEESVSEKMGRVGEWPGARRRSYLAVTILLPVVWSLEVSRSKDFLTDQFGSHIMDVVNMCATFLPLVAGFYFGLERLLNLGMSRWWYLVNLPMTVAIVWFGFDSFRVPDLPPGQGWLVVSVLVVFMIPALWVGYRSAACPAGYGFHKKIDGLGVALAIFYWLLTPVMFITIAGTAAILLGRIGDAELRDQLQETLRAVNDLMK